MMKLTAHGTIKPRKGMNRTEAKYGQHLELRLRAGQIAWYKFEGITFKLADDTRYTPDFVLMLTDGTIECHEVKGFWRDDAKVKIKVAAEMFPFVFRSVMLKHGGWEITCFGGEVEKEAAV